MCFIKNPDAELYTISLFTNCIDPRPGRLLQCRTAWSCPADPHPGRLFQCCTSRPCSADPHPGRLFQCRTARSCPADPHPGRLFQRPYRSENVMVFLSQPPASYSASQRRKSENVMVFLSHPGRLFQRPYRSENVMVFLCQNPKRQMNQIRECNDMSLPEPDPSADSHRIIEQLNKVCISTCIQS